MTRLSGRIVKCTNVLWFDLDQDPLYSKGENSPYFPLWS